MIERKLYEDLTDNFHFEKYYNEDVEENNHNDDKVVGKTKFFKIDGNEINDEK